MPRIVALPPKPQATFGVFNNRNNIASPDDDRFSRQRNVVGWQIFPTYGYPHKRTVLPEREMQECLESSIERWQSRVKATKKAAMTMSEVLVDRVIAQVSQGTYGFRFYFADGTSVSLERTRGYHRPSMEGPMEGPFIIRRALADCRTFRLTDGRSLISSTKLEIDSSTIPDWIVDQIFSD